MRRYGESKTHDDCKERIARICIRKGWTAEVDTHKFECNTEKGPRTYWPDVYAENFCTVRTGSTSRTNQKLPSGGRRIILEIQGKGGHNTKLAHALDSLRVLDLRASAGESFEYYELQLAKRGQKRGPNDVRNWSDEDIIEHLGLNS